MAHQVGMPTPNFHNRESSCKSQDCLACLEIIVCLFKKWKLRRTFSFLSCVLYSSSFWIWECLLFLHLMKVENLVVSYLKIWLLREGSKYQAK